MCKKSVAQVSQWGLFVWTMCENMEKTVKKVSEPFFSNKLPFFWAINGGRTQNYRKYTGWNKACENRCSDVTLSEQVFRECYV